MLFAKLSSKYLRLQPWIFTALDLGQGDFSLQCAAVNTKLVKDCVCPINGTIHKNKPPSHHAGLSTGWKSNWEQCKSRRMWECGEMFAVSGRDTVTAVTTFPVAVTTYTRTPKIKPVKFKHS